MMYRLLLSAFMVTAMMQTSPAFQTTTSSTTVKDPDSPSASKVPASAISKQPAGAKPAASEPIITLRGLCTAPTATQAKAGGACATVVTKQQFDTVVNALNAIGTPLLREQYRMVAEGYTTTLLNYEAAKKAGVERDPRFAEVLRLARMRAMGDMYKALLQEQARKVSPEEVQEYYKNNTDKLEELTLRRLVVPRYNSANLKDEEFTAKARKIADDIRDRAAKGEDVDKLQKEACEALGVKDPPTTRMGVVRRGLYAPEQEKQIFALKPGDVTPVFEQSSALLIFKLEGRETPSLEKSRDEIVRTLIQQHSEKAEKSATGSVKIEYNEQFLGPAPPSARTPSSQASASPASKSGQHK